MVTSLLASSGANIQSELREVRQEAATNYITLFSPSQPLPAEGNMLVLQDVTEEDEGTYVCRAANTAGSAQQRLQVIIEPGNSQRPSREYQPQQYHE